MIKEYGAFYISELIWNEESNTNAEIAKKLRHGNGMSVYARDIDALKRRAVVAINNGADDFEAILAETKKLMQEE